MRKVAFVAVVALLAVMFIGVTFAVRTPQQSAVLAPPTAPAARTASPPPTPDTVTPRISLSPTPAPTPSGPFINPTYKFSVVLPPLFRKSAVLSLPPTGGNNPSAADAFTARTEADEARLAPVRCETACEIWNYVAVVQVYTGVNAETTPRQWYTSRGGTTREKIEEITVDHRSAIRVTNGAQYPVELVVKDGDRMFVVAYQIYSLPAPPGATQEALEQILASFKIVP